METTPTSNRNDLEANAARVVDDLAETVDRLRRLRDLGRADDAAETLADELRDEPLSVDKLVTYRVTLSTGGPASGVDFRSDGTAAAWYQDWFTPKVYAELADDVASELAETWYIGYDDDADGWAS
jgi:hypothetical protein